MRKIDIASLVSSGKISTVEQWREQVSIGNLSLEDEIEELLHCIFVSPEHQILTKTLFDDWKKRQYPHLIANKQAIPGEAPSYTANRFKVDDLVFLEARTTEAASLLERYGHWWKFTACTRQGQDAMLRSISKQKRTEPKTKVEVLVIGRAGDWRYDVTNSIPSPCSEDSIPKVDK